MDDDFAPEHKVPSGLITTIQFDVSTGEDIVKYILDLVSILAL